MLKFYKYHGAGNDFIMLDNRDGSFNVKDVARIRLLCHRRFGIGADGIFLLENQAGYDFKMVFANNDGSMGSMCGNGGRCIVDFAHNVLKIIKPARTTVQSGGNPKKIKFMAIDGEHEAEILDNGLIKLKMQNVKEVGTRNGLPFIRQGTTPHNILFVEDIKNFPVVETGKKIRNLDTKGVNTNFVQIIDGTYHVRTYERGVEDETWACGTGATSVAIASHHLGILKENICHIHQPGGDLTIEFDPPERPASSGRAGKTKNGYENIWLTGPAVCAFEGETNL